jgi:hypothetical protein
MLEILFKLSDDKLAKMSSFLGERLSTLALLRANSVILEGESTDDTAMVMTLIRDFLATEGQHDFELTATGDKITVKALTEEAESWAKRQDSRVGLPPGLYQCFHCGKIFTNSDDLKAHVIIHYA